MDELKIIMEALTRMGEGATLAFMWWCMKESFAYLMVPTTFAVIGITTYKSIVAGIRAYNETHKPKGDCNCDILHKEPRGLQKDDM